MTDNRTTKEKEREDESFRVRYWYRVLALT